MINLVNEFTYFYNTLLLSSFKIHRQYLHLISTFPFYNFSFVFVYHRSGRNHILSIPVDLRPSVYQIKFIIFPLCGLRPLDNQITESNLSVFVNRTKVPILRILAISIVLLELTVVGRGRQLRILWGLLLIT